jgi:hypothetical protein
MQPTTLGPRNRDLLETEAGAGPLSGAGARGAHWQS